MIRCEGLPANFLLTSLAMVGWGNAPVIENGAALRYAPATQANSQRGNPCGCSTAQLSSIMECGGSISGFAWQFRRVLKSMATYRRIKVTDSGQVAVVTFNDSKIIDEAEIQEFGQELYDLVEREGRKKIILNFGNVEFLSSAALGKLIGFDKRVKQHDAELMLSNIRPEIYEVFAITKLTKLFDIKDDEADALAAM
jgi:anti-sigma B factor antagonist